MVVTRVAIRSMYSVRNTTRTGHAELDFLWFLNNTLPLQHKKVVNILKINLTSATYSYVIGTASLRKKEQ